MPCTYMDKCSDLKREPSEICIGEKAYPDKKGYGDCKIYAQYEAVKSELISLSSKA